MDTNDSVVVTVAIPTYRRQDELSALLPEIDRHARNVTEDGSNGFRVNVLVVDNNPDGSGAMLANAMGLADLRAVVEPSPGVSAVRNRALLETAASDLLIFIDDDERPTEKWLATLLSTWDAANRPAAVAGRVVSEFSGPIDSWIEAGGFFVRRSLPTGTSIDVAATNNLLLDLRTVRALGLTFDPAFGLTGGEDTLFTRSISAAGERMVWCNEAVVIDRVPVDRSSRRWVLARAASYGNARSLVDVYLARSRAARMQTRGRNVGEGALRMVVGGARCLLGVLARSERHQAQGLRTAYRGAGMAAGALGFKYQEYARSHHRRLFRRRTRAPGEPLRVLQSFPTPKATTNPYLVMLASSLEASGEAVVLNFSYRLALTGRYDVFHVHWPENLVSSAGPLKRLVRQALFALLLVRLRTTSTPVIRTLHNLELPSGLSRRQVMLLRWAERWTTLWIRVNDDTPIAADRAHETVVHGHYKDWYGGTVVPESIQGRLTYFGLIRRYKNVDGLIEAFKQVDSSVPMTLRVAGKPSSEDIARQLEALAHDDERISLLLRFLSDDQLVHEVGEAQLVVLPYREMHNSGSLLASLSLGRPVLVPDNEVNRRFRDEVGREWVQLYGGELSAEHLVTALHWVHQRRAAEVPDLSARDWDKAGRSHMQAYRRALQLAGAKQSG